MPTLRHVSIPERNSKYNGLHVEAPGCIVNIQKGLFDAINNRKVTTVTIIADAYVGEEWNLPDFGGQRLHVRIAEGKPEEFEFKIEPDNGRGLRKVIHITYRKRVWRLEFRQAGGLFYYAFLKSQEPEIELNLGEFRRVEGDSFWPRAWEENTERAQTALKRMYAIAQGG